MGLSMLSQPSDSIMAVLCSIKEKREPHHAHSAIRGPETAIATERAMVESPRVV